MNDPNLKEERSSSLMQNYQRPLVLWNRHISSFSPHTNMPFVPLLSSRTDATRVLVVKDRHSALNPRERRQPDHPGKDFLSEAKSKRMEEKHKRGNKVVEKWAWQFQLSFIKDHSRVGKKTKKRLAHAGHVWPDVLLNNQLQQRCLLGDETCRVAIKWQLCSISCNLTAAARTN